MGCLVAAGGLWVLDGSGWLGCLIVLGGYGACFCLVDGVIWWDS